MPFDLQSSYFFYITKLSNNTIVKNRKVRGLQRRRMRQLYTKSRLMWFLFQLGFPPKQTLRQDFGCKEFIREVTPGSMWPHSLFGGKSARHKALEANEDAAVGESGVTQANQPREGADYAVRGQLMCPVAHMEPGIKCVG